MRLRRGRARRIPVTIGKREFCAKDQLCGENHLRPNTFMGFSARSFQAQFSCPAWLSEFINPMAAVDREQMQRSIANLMSTRNDIAAQLANAADPLAMRS